MLQQIKNCFPGAECTWWCTCTISEPSNHTKYIYVLIFFVSVFTTVKNKNGLIAGCWHWVSSDRVPHVRSGVEQSSWRTVANSALDNNQQGSNQHSNGNDSILSCCCLYQAHRRQMNIGATKEGGVQEGSPLPLRLFLMRKWNTNFPVISAFFFHNLVQFE